ncbi:hypothetical protein ACJMK2_003043 [Sinanodonta woodiana]|uniref:Uncharacterized protein n=1 Tax=Sinanodonta woodiana TaxID=1069815 RepID=A0ABD3XX46_SINWO
MHDIEALRLLTEEMQRIQTLCHTTPSYDEIKTFDKMATEVVDHALDTKQKVDRYGEAISEKMEEMRSALKQSTTKIMEQIKKAIDYLAGKHSLHNLNTRRSNTMAFICCSMYQIQLQIVQV